MVLYYYRSYSWSGSWYIPLLFRVYNLMHYLYTMFWCTVSCFWSGAMLLYPYVVLYCVASIWHHVPIALCGATPGCQYRAPCFYSPLRCWTGLSVSGTMLLYPFAALHRVASIWHHAPISLCGATPGCQCLTCSIMPTVLCRFMSLYGKMSILTSGFCTATQVECLRSETPATPVWYILLYHYTA